MPGEDTGTQRDAALGKPGCQLLCAAYFPGPTPVMDISCGQVTLHHYTAIFLWLEHWLFCAHISPASSLAETQLAPGRLHAESYYCAHCS